MRKRLLFGTTSAALVAGSLVFTGCGSDPGTSTGGGSSSATSTGASMNEDCGDAEVVNTAGCGIVVKAGAPGVDDTTALQTALIEAKSGSSVCLCPGTFKLDKQLSLTVHNVTVKGVGAGMEDTVLDFAGDLKGGNDTMLVTGDGFTIENLWVKNTPGNGVVVRQAANPTFRKLKVSWDGGPKASNGAYSIYPAECTNVLVEDCDVEGASDAAIYVGQSTGAIIRRNKAHGSVLGIELENTTNGEAYDNECWDNTAGLAVFLLGNLDKKTAEKNLLHHNNVYDNNRGNFGDPSTIVASVPNGTGIIIVGADDTEIRDNTIKGNKSVGVLVLSYQLMAQIVPGTKVDPKVDPDPERTSIHDNIFDSNGTDPQSLLTEIGVKPLENVLWDGIAKSGMPASNDAKFCLGTKTPIVSFRMFAGEHLLDPDMGKMYQSTDTKPYECDLPPLPSSAP